jgi:1,6-anhydro-N-acetylmuramate kinase
MAQVTLDGLSREHGKGIDMKSLAAIREQLLDLKIRMKTDEEDKPVPLQQDIRLIDYLQEFETFIGKQQLSAKQKEFVMCHGREVLQSVMDEHRETAE